MRSSLDTPFAKRSTSSPVVPARALCAAPRSSSAAPTARARRTVEIEDALKAIETLKAPADAPRPAPGAFDLRAVFGMGCLMRLALSPHDAAGVEPPVQRRADTLTLARAALSLIAEPAAIVDRQGDLVGANQAFFARRGLFGPMLCAVCGPAAGRIEEPDDADGARRPSLRYDAASGGVAAIYVLRDSYGTECGKLALLRAPNRTLRCCAPALLEQALALTPAEAKLACALMRTKSLPAASRELGLKEKTGRTYLDRVFQKTGAKSQLQLYALLMELYLLSRAEA